jgi:hypothetical protein
MAGIIMMVIAGNKFDEIREQQEIEKLYTGYGQ